MQTASFESTYPIAERISWRRNYNVLATRWVITCSSAAHLDRPA
jgi:hypothetical protein